MKKSNNIYILLCIISAFSANIALAKDLGVQGKVWTIEERDLREKILQSAAKVDEESIKDQFKTSVDRYFNEFPRRQLPTIEKGQTKFIDLSVVVKEDISAPIKENGRWGWKTIVQKGTRVNPLDTVNISRSMFFFDGADIDQVELLKHLLAKHPYSVIPIESGGSNILKLMKDNNVSIYYANDSFINRFQITHLPSLVYPGQGQYAKFMAVSSFSRPFDTRVVDSVLNQAFPNMQKLNKQAGNDGK